MADHSCNDMELSVRRDQQLSQLYPFMVTRGGIQTVVVHSGTLSLRLCKVLWKPALFQVVATCSSSHAKTTDADQDCDDEGKAMNESKLKFSLVIFQRGLLGHARRQRVELSSDVNFHWSNDGHTLNPRLEFSIKTPSDDGDAKPRRFTCRASNAAEYLEWTSVLRSAIECAAPRTGKALSVPVSETSTLHSSSEDEAGPEPLKHQRVSALPQATAQDGNHLVASANSRPEQPASRSNKKQYGVPVGRRRRASVARLTTEATPLPSFRELRASRPAEALATNVPAPRTEYGPQTSRPAAPQTNSSRRLGASSILSSARSRRRIGLSFSTRSRRRGSNAKPASMAKLVSIRAVGATAGKTKAPAAAGHPTVKDQRHLQSNRSMAQSKLPVSVVRPGMLATEFNASNRSAASDCQDITDESVTRSTEYADYLAMVAKLRSAQQHQPLLPLSRRGGQRVVPRSPSAHEDTLFQTARSALDLDAGDFDSESDDDGSEIDYDSQRHDWRAYLETEL